MDRTVSSAYDPVTEREVAMNRDERELRQHLAALSADERGRRLLQLSLRGISTGEQELSAGCWVDRGVAGCLFQHAYWQGVREGVFADDGPSSRDWVSSLAGPDLYYTVIRAIGAFDRLARAEYGAGRLRRSGLRRDDWRRAVTGMLVEALAVADQRELVAR